MEPTEALQRALDQIVRIVEGSAAAALRATDQRTPDSFAPSVAVTDDAPASDRLAGFTGRAV